MQRANYSIFWLNVYGIIIIYLFIDIVKGECTYDFDSDISKSGNFTSPQWPNNYPNEIRCVYNFVGKKFQVINITFVVFDLEPAFTKGCLTDYIDISSITNFNVKRLLGRYCGNDVPSPLISLHSKLEIIFTSNHVFNRRGFYGFYEFLDESRIGPPDSSPRNIVGCGGNVTGVGGVLLSPNYPDPFPQKIDCVWLIRVRQDQHIYVRMDQLQLIGSIAYCKDAHLAIYDGFESLEFEPAKPKQYCGDITYYKNVEDKVTLSSSNRLLIRFKTDVTTAQWNEQVSVRQMSGFKLIWTAISFKLSGQCKEFACQNSQFCLKPTGKCTELHSFCIDSSLQCNELPNCSEHDNSDEDKCNVSLFIGAGAGLGTTIIVLMICFCCCRHNRTSKKEISTNIGLNNTETSMQLRQLEHSPSYTSRTISNFFPTAVNPPIGDMINCSVHGLRPALQVHDYNIQHRSPYHRDGIINKYVFQPTDV